MRTTGQSQDNMTTSRTDPASRKTAVIIPYYQEESGILRQAVLSAIAQEGVGELGIIVVDDGSPAPARDDLQGLVLPAHVTLKLIEQPNRGPGAARNRGLEAISSDTAYVAFLDSDDRWTKDHLERAICALGMGYDFYFANHWHSGSNESHWDRSNRPIDNVCVDPEHGFCRFVGIADPCVSGSDRPWSPTLGGHPSTIVLRRASLGDLRFTNKLIVGEDRLFWRELVLRSDRGVFSTKVESISGPGIHICESTQWGTRHAAWRAYHYMRWHKWLQLNFEMTESQARDNARMIKQLRRQFLVSLLHELRRFRGMANPYVIRFFLVDPAALIAFPVVTGEVVCGKARGWRTRAVAAPTSPSGHVGGTDDKGGHAEEI